MRRRTTVIAATVAVAALAASAAWAFYSLTSNSVSRGFTAASLGTPVTGSPTATPTSVSFAVSAPSTGPTPSGYRVDRTAPTSATNVCASLATGPGTCTDSAPVAGQTNTYSVYALLGANWASNSPAPVSVAVPSVATPAVAITFPANGASYNGAGWTAGCGTASTDDICGTSSNAASVSVSVRQGTGNYWNGSSFGSASEVLSTATGTTSWSLAFAGSRFTNGQAYTVRAVAGTASASTTFTWDTTGPSAIDASSANTSGSTAGKIEAADTLTLTFSESVDPASIASGWNGSARNVVVHGNDSSGSDTLTIFDSTNSTQVPIGTISLGETGFFSGNVTYGLTGTASTMTLSSGTLTITLGTVSDATKLGTLSASNQKSKLTWTPTTTIKDLAGNACSTTPFLGANATQF